MEKSIEITRERWTKDNCGYDDYNGKPAYFVIITGGKNTRERLGTYADHDKRFLFFSANEPWQYGQFADFDKWPADHCHEAKEGCVQACGNPVFNDGMTLDDVEWDIVQATLKSEAERAMKNPAHPWHGTIVHACV